MRTDHLAVYMVELLAITTTELQWEEQLNHTSYSVAESLTKDTSKQQNIMNIHISKARSKNHNYYKIKIISKRQNDWDRGRTGRHRYSIRKEVGRMRTAVGNTKRTI